MEVEEITITRTITLRRVVRKCEPENHPPRTHVLEAEGVAIEEPLPSNVIPLRRAG